MIYLTPLKFYQLKEIPVNPPINALSDEAKMLPDLLGQVIIEQEGKDIFDTVSYTHLTLPTKA